MAYNRVVYGSRTLIDLSGDTVSPDGLANGITAHNAAGVQVTGTMVPAWSRLVDVPSKYRDADIDVDCTACPGWQRLTASDFVVGFVRASGWYSSKKTDPTYSCSVTGYDRVTGQLTVSMETNGGSKYWVSTQLIVATKGGR